MNQIKKITTTLRRYLHTIIVRAVYRDIMDGGQLSFLKR